MMNLHDDACLSQALRSRGMTRGRGLEDYQKKLGVDIADMAKKRVSQKGRFLWYDLCCGYFSSAKELYSECGDIADQVTTVGVDLDVRSERVYYGNAVTFPISKDADLVTCLQGLNYIEFYLRFGAGTVERWYNQLSDGAVLAFTSFAGQIRIAGKDISDYLKERLGDDVDVFPTPDCLRSYNSIVIRCRDDRLNLPLRERMIGY
jgi:hypothetical protein